MFSFVAVSHACHLQGTTKWRALFLEPARNLEAHRQGLVVALFFAGSAKHFHLPLAPLEIRGNSVMSTCLFEVSEEVKLLVITLLDIVLRNMTVSAEAEREG